MRSTEGTRPGRRVGARLVVIAAIVSAVLFGSASVASAHAVVLSSNPADGQVVPVAPKDVQIQFSEAVSMSLGGLTVLDTEGRRVDSGDAAAGITADTIRVGLEDDLPDGTYVANYRIVSADGHPVSGAIIFGVGANTTVDKAGAQGLRAATDPTFEIAGAVLRFITYAGALLAAGLAFFLAFLHDHRADRWRMAPIVRVSCLVGALGAIGSIGTQAALATGRGLPAVGDLTVLHQVLTESLGWSTVVLLVGLAAVHLSTNTDRLPLTQGLAFYGGLSVAVSFVLSGHATGSADKWLAILADGVHVATGAIWFGGLVGLGLTLKWRDRTRRELAAPVPVSAGAGSASPSTVASADESGDDEDDDGDPGPTLVEDTASIVARFSYVAALSVVVLLTAGGALAWTQIGSISSLFSTTYGRVLLAKVVVVLAIVAVAAYNRYRLVPDLLDESLDDEDLRDEDEGDEDGPHARDGDDDSSWVRLFRTVRIEALAILVVLALTSVLVNVTPSRAATNPAGVFNETTPITQGGQVNLVVAPDKAGKNTLHISYLDDQGRPADLVSQLTVEFSLPEKGVGPISRDAPRAGPGHFLLEGDELSIAGDWQVTLIGRLSEFEQARSTFTVTVAP